MPSRERWNRRGFQENCTGKGTWSQGEHEVKEKTMMKTNDEAAMCAKKQALESIEINEGNIIQGNQLWLLDSVIHTLYDLE